MAAARRTLAAVGLLLIAALVAGCGDHATVPVPHPTGAEAAACSRFMAALPPKLADHSLAAPLDGGYQASYGDPAIVVSCGVGAPAGFEVGAQCEVANGVGWYLPSQVYDDQTIDATVTAAGYRPRVQVLIPATYRPSAIAAVMAELAAPVKKYFHKTEGCV